MTYFSGFLAMLVYVFTRSFQQLNVTHSRYALIIPTSLTMATLDVVLVGMIAGRGAFDPILCLALGFGGGFGSIVAVYLHKHWRKN